MPLFLICFYNWIGQPLGKDNRKILLNTHNFTDKQWEKLSPNKNIKNLALKCSIRGKVHNTDEHSQVMTDIPQQPEDLIDDLVKVEKLQFDKLDPQQPQAYLKQQIDRFGV